MSSASHPRPIVAGFDNCPIAARLDRQSLLVNRVQSTTHWRLDPSAGELGRESMIDRLEFLSDW